MHFPTGKRSCGEMHDSVFTVLCIQYSRTCATCLYAFLRISRWRVGSPFPAHYQKERRFHPLPEGEGFSRVCSINTFWRPESYSTDARRLLHCYLHLFDAAEPLFVYWENECFSHGRFLQSKLKPARKCVYITCSLSCLTGRKECSILENVDAGWSSG
jgi:hypothetical protein